MPWVCEGILYYTETQCNIKSNIVIVVYEILELGITYGQLMHQLSAIIWWTFVWKTRGLYPIWLVRTTMICCHCVYKHCSHNKKKKKERNGEELLTKKGTNAFNRRRALGVFAFLLDANSICYDETVRLICNRFSCWSFCVAHAFFHWYFALLLPRRVLSKPHASLSLFSFFFVNNLGWPKQSVNLTPHKREKLYICRFYDFSVICV